MSRSLPVLVAVFCLVGTPACAEDYYLIDIGGDYENIYVVPAGSLVDLGEGSKRADLLAVSIASLELAEDSFAAIGSLDVMVTEVQCRSTPRQFKEDSEYAQLMRSYEPVDKTDVNPYPDWTPVPAGTFIERFADFVCQWSGSQSDQKYDMISAESKWDLVDSLARTVERLKSKN